MSSLSSFRKNNTDETPNRLDPSTAKGGDVKETFNTAHPSSGLQDFPPAFAQHIHIVSQYIDTMHEISRKVIAGLACALDLPPEKFLSSHSGAENRCRFIHYPPVDKFEGRYASHVFASR